MLCQIVVSLRWVLMELIQIQEMSHKCFLLELSLCKYVVIFHLLWLAGYPDEVERIKAKMTDVREAGSDIMIADLLSNP